MLDTRQRKGRSLKKNVGATLKLPAPLSSRNRKSRQKNANVASSEKEQTDSVPKKRKMLLQKDAVPMLTDIKS